MNDDKLIESIKTLKFEKGDILIVKLKEKAPMVMIEMLRKEFKRVIPKDLEVKVIFSNPDVEFEILRRVNNNPGTKQ
jgi:hypothetical protein